RSRPACAPPLLPGSALFPYTTLFRSRRGDDQRFHVAQTVAWKRLKAGVEFDHVTSDLELDRRGFGTFTEEGHLQSAVQFVGPNLDRKSTRLNSSHVSISSAVFCLNKK